MRTNISLQSPDLDRRVKFDVIAPPDLYHRRCDLGAGWHSKLAPLALLNKNLDHSNVVGQSDGAVFVHVQVKNWR